MWRRLIRRQCQFPASNSDSKINFLHQKLGLDTAWGFEIVSAAEAVSPRGRASREVARTQSTLYRGRKALSSHLFLFVSAGHLAGGEGCQLARWDLMETLEADVSLAMWIRRPP